MTEGYAFQAIQSVLNGQKAYCKFLSGNDTGLTGAHQAGIYISKPSISILFDTPGEKGSNKEKWVKIKWQNDLVTDTRFIYYGQGTRNEYRITNFGRGFPFLRPEYTGALFVLVQRSSEDYQGFFLNTEDEINQFLDAFGISPTETNGLIEMTQVRPEAREKAEFDRFIESLDTDFPLSEAMSAAARHIQDKVYDHAEYALTNPDVKLLDWTDMEYKLFRALARQSPHGQWRRESADWRKPTFDKAEAGNANEPEPKRSRPDGRTKLDVHKMSISCRNCAEELEENNLRMLRQGVGVILRRRCERV